MSQLSLILERLGQEYTQEWDVKVYFDDGGAETIRGLTEGQKIMLAWILARCNIPYRECKVVRRKRSRKLKNAGHVAGF